MGQLLLREAEWCGQGSTGTSGSHIPAERHASICCTIADNARSNIYTHVLSQTDSYELLYSDGVTGRDAFCEISACLCKLGGGGYG